MVSYVVSPTPRGGELHHSRGRNSAPRRRRIRLNPFSPPGTGCQVLIQRIFVDANVLYSRSLRDWLFLLRSETEGMFQIHTTEDVLAETEYRLRRNNPTMLGGVITDLRKKITDSIDELVGDYDATIPYGGPDPHDRHVHAAAIASHAHILLTNDAGFEGSDEEPYEVFNCDDFFILVDDSAR